MRRVYDVFERFPDGCIFWHASVQGRFEAERKRQELAAGSGSEFFLIDIKAEDFLPTSTARIVSRPVTNRAVAG